MSDLEIASELLPERHPTCQWWGCSRRH